LGERDLKVAALKLAPELGIADADVVLANVDRKSIVYEDGKPANLADVLEAATQKLAEALGIPGGSRNVSSGLPANPAGLETQGLNARKLGEFPRLGTPGLFKIRAKRVKGER